MPTDIKQDAFTKMLLAVLDETYDKADGLYLDSGTHWLGTLAKLDATAASKPIVEGGSSVAAHVRHATFYLAVMERYAREGMSGERPDWKAAWKQTEVTEAEWAALQADLDATWKRVRTMLAGVGDFNDEKALGAAMGVMAHTAYHLGAVRQFLTTL